MSDAYLDSDALAARIVAMRRHHGLTRGQLAGRVSERGVNLSTAALGNIETGRRDGIGQRTRRITVEELAAFSAIFGLTVEEMLSARPVTVGV